MYCYEKNPTRHFSTSNFTFFLCSGKKIEVTKTTSTTASPKPRSGVIQPTVYVDTDICQLSISMVSSDSYTLYVCDRGGRVVCQESVVSDGGRHTYFLPQLEADLYSVLIESNSNAYEGEFFVY